MIVENITDVQKLFADYTGGRYSVRYNTEKEIITEESINQKSPSGWRADVREQRRIVEPAEVDDEGRVINDAVIESVFDVRVPEWMNLPVELRSQTTEEKILEEVNKKIDGIADIIETGLQGKELADEIRRQKT